MATTIERGPYLKNKRGCQSQGGPRRNALFVFLIGPVRGFSVARGLGQ